jgi:Tfp pilus assembly protein PilX
VIHAFFQPRGARRIASTPSSRTGQRGISLIIAMVMLVVVGFVSVAIMRNATNSDQVAMSNRLQTQANLFAQAALQFCESQILAATPQITIQNVTSPQVWTQKDNWLQKKNGVYELKSADLPSANTPVHYPQCVVEIDADNPSNKLYLVTARGFSNDYTFDSTSGATRSGSSVWLQSQVLAY